MSKLHLFLVTYLGLHYLALPVFGSFRYLTLACEHLVPLPLLDIIICPFLDYYILSIFYHLGSPLSYHTLIFDLMSSRNMYLYNTYIYTYILIVSISDEDSLSEIALSGASKLASAYFTLFYISVHVLYTGKWI